MKVLPILIAIPVALMTMNIFSQTPKEFAAEWDKQHLSRILPSNLRHEGLLEYLAKLKKLGLRIEPVGKSYGGRDIYQAEWGKGKLKVFMWSQMHGDEPTATSAVIDMLAFLQQNRDKAWVESLSEKVTIRVVPMLNPDGAELYQRRNLQFIDINRDARDLATPEGQLLKKLRDEWKPEIGFNLHNQNPLTTVGDTKNQATISLLAVSGNAEGISNEGHIRSKRLCGVMIGALEQFIKGNIGRYDDSYNARAFGDRMSEWGTATILVETGALKGKDEMFLVKLNFIAYLAALQSLADGSEKKADPAVYGQIPFNTNGGVFNVVFRDATVVNILEDKTLQEFRADIGINAERRRASEASPMFVQDIGDLFGMGGLNEYDLKGFYFVARERLLKVGTPAEFYLYRIDKAEDIDWKAADLPRKYPPDAHFKDGKWIKPMKAK